ncbi:hypothetical protein CL616_04435 [archaeon]|nr:hypothetical protein [archaeon]
MVLYFVGPLHEEEKVEEYLDLADSYEALARNSYAFAMAELKKGLFLDPLKLMSFCGNGLSFSSQSRKFRIKANDRMAFLRKQGIEHLIS